MLAHQVCRSTVADRGPGRQSLPRASHGRETLFKENPATVFDSREEYRTGCVVLAS